MCMRTVYHHCLQRDVSAPLSHKHGGQQSHPITDCRNPNVTAKTSYEYILTNWFLSVMRKIYCKKSNVHENNVSSLSKVCCFQHLFTHKHGAQPNHLICNHYQYLSLMPSTLGTQE